MAKAKSMNKRKFSKLDLITLQVSLIQIDKRSNQIIKLIHDNGTKT